MGEDYRRPTGTTPVRSGKYQHVPARLERELSEPLIEVACSSYFPMSPVLLFAYSCSRVPVSYGGRR